MERALPWEGAEVAMKKTRPRGEKDLDLRRKLRLIKGGLWGANPKAPDGRDKRRVRNLAVLRTAGASASRVARVSPYGPRPAPPVSTTRRS